MNIDTNTLIFIALAIMMILIVICFICNSINSSKINTLMDYSDEGDIIGALKDYYDKVWWFIKDCKWYIRRGFDVATCKLRKWF